MEKCLDPFKAENFNSSYVFPRHRDAVVSIHIVWFAVQYIALLIKSVVIKKLPVYSNLNSSLLLVRPYYKPIELNEKGAFCALYKN